VRSLRLPLVRLRPPGIERGRRLAEFIRSRPDIKKVAIAVPATGGDRTLAVGFGAAFQTIGRELVVLEYEGGRRDYAAEARRFVDSGAGAILFTGPGEESGEWLLALDRLRSRPLVLGTEDELHPQGFHPPLRSKVEGAVLVGSDWEERSGPLAEVRTGEELTTPGPDYRRGYRAGWMYARAVLDGNFTPSSLARAFARRSFTFDPSGAIVTPIVAMPPAGGKPVEIAVPMWIVRDGGTKALPGF